MRRGLSCFLAVIALACLILPAGAAEVPYQSFVQTETDAGLPAPAAYETADIHDGKTLGGDAWDTPQDMVFDRDGNLYLLDTNNDRILIYDKNLKPVREIRELKRPDGQPDTLARPRSLFVSDTGCLYVADTNRERCLKLDQNGNILREYLRPEDEAYTSEIYNPIKILADSKGLVYIISQNVYQGIILYTDEGEFQGYFGSPPVVVSAKLLVDRFWKSLLSKKMREGLSDYVPVEYTSFDMDDEGFIYTASVYTDGDKEQIRRLNYLGSNILENKDNLGESEIFTYRRETWSSQFTDICVAEENIIALDSRYQRLYVFNMRGDRLMTFGTSGEQKGAFLRASAVEYRDGLVYVLDSLKNNLTVFRPTPYGQLILDASHYDSQGDYDEAEAYWNQVLAQNANCEMAYTGIGEARLKNKDYSGAIEYFRLGNNRERESVAFGYYRSQWLREHMVLGIGLLLAVLVALLFLTNRRFLSAVTARIRRKKRGDSPPKQRAWRIAGQVMLHPLDTLNELKHKRYQNIGFIAAVLLLWTLVNILSRQFTSFRFSTYDPDTFNLPVQLAVSVLPFVLIAGVNWAVCAILNGEGKFWEISTYLAFAMLPYIIVTALSLVLSQFLTLDEAVFLQFVQWIGILWSLLLVFQGQRIVHNYTTGKTVGIAVLTVAGAAVVLIILLLLFTLVLQVTSFVSSIYSELSLRK